MSRRDQNYFSPSQLKAQSMWCNVKTVCPEVQRSSWTPLRQSYWLVTDMRSHGCLCFQATVSHSQVNGFTSDYLFTSDPRLEHRKRSINKLERLVITLRLFCRKCCLWWRIVPSEKSAFVSCWWQNCTGTRISKVCQSFFIKTTYHKDWK